MGAEKVTGPYRRKQCQRQMVPEADGQNGGMRPDSLLAFLYWKAKNSDELQEGAHIIGSMDGGMDGMGQWKDG